MHQLLMPSPETTAPGPREAHWPERAASLNGTGAGAGGRLWEARGAASVPEARPTGFGAGSRNYQLLSGTPLPGVLPSLPVGLGWHAQPRAP